MDLTSKTTNKIILSKFILFSVTAARANKEHPKYTPDGVPSYATQIAYSLGFLASAGQSTLYKDDV